MSYKSVHGRYLLVLDKLGPKQQMSGSCLGHDISSQITLSIHLIPTILSKDR